MRIINTYWHHQCGTLVVNWLTPVNKLFWCCSISVVVQVLLTAISALFAVALWRQVDVAIAITADLPPLG